MAGRVCSYSRRYSSLWPPLTSASNDPVPLQPLANFLIPKRFKHLVVRRLVKGSAVFPLFCYLLSWICWIFTSHLFALHVRPIFVSFGSHKNLAHVNKKIANIFPSLDKDLKNNVNICHDFFNSIGCSTFRLYRSYCSSVFRYPRFCDYDSQNVKKLVLGMVGYIIVLYMRVICVCL